MLQGISKHRKVFFFF